MIRVLLSPDVLAAGNTCPEAVLSGATTATQTEGGKVLQQPVGVDC